MIRIPKQFVENLDNQYDDICKKINKHKEEFNKQLFEHINNKYSVKQNKHTDEPASNKQNPEEEKSNDATSDTNIYDIILFNDPIELDKSQENDKSDISGEYKENDKSDISAEYKENDISGEYKENDKSDISGENSTEDQNNCENDESGQNSGTSFKNSYTVKKYKIPELIYPTKKKITKKFYKKLIVRLHPDKCRNKNSMLFQNYYNSCVTAKKQNCLYKFWLLAANIKLKIKITNNIEKSFNKEINILKKYIEDLNESIINKWIETDDNVMKKNLIEIYIRQNMTME